jgi:hypothetical protein
MKIFSAGHPLRWSPQFDGGCCGMWGGRGCLALRRHQEALALERRRSGSRSSRRCGSGAVVVVACEGKAHRATPRFWFCEHSHPSEAALRAIRCFGFLKAPPSFTPFLEDRQIQIKHSLELDSELKLLKKAAMT